MNMRPFTTLAAVSALALGLAACASDTERTTTDSGVEVVSKGNLTVCTHLPYEPFQYNKGGEIVGFDVELMDLVAEDLGLKQKIVNTPFETIETGQAMATGKCDIAAAGMTITEVRAEALDFSDPYFDATQALLVKADSDIDSLEDLAGKKLGVQAATTGEIYAGELPTIEARFEDEHDLATLLGWADETRTMQVWANADYPRDAERARAFGAQGIGLCRTEHMFFEEDRLPTVRRMILNAHAGTKYGVSFPVLCRASFGVKGANIPAMLRAIVACGWFGIQTWIGGALGEVMGPSEPPLLIDAAPSAMSTAPLDATI